MTEESYQFSESLLFAVLCLVCLLLAALICGVVIVVIVVVGGCCLNCDAGTTGTGTSPV